MAALRTQVMRRKPIATLTAETGADTGRGGLARTIGLFQLSKIVRHSPVPVVVVPQGRIEEPVDAPGAG